MNTTLEPLSASELWSIRSDLPERLRLANPELMTSQVLRHHCKITLTSCHWLRGFRINKLNGTLVIRFPRHRRRELSQLLHQALSLPLINRELMAPLAHLRMGQLEKHVNSHPALRHGLAIGFVLLAEIVLPIPVALMSSAAVIALIPLLRESWHHLRHERSLPPETLELAFSGVLVGHGHPGEALLDLFMGDATETINLAVSGEEEFHGVSHELLDRIGNLVTLELCEAERSTCRLREARRGDRYRVDLHSHVFLASRLIEGELIVLNRLYDGDWQPRRLRAGDEIHEGAFIIKGQGILEVARALDEHGAYQLSRVLERPEIHSSSSEGILSGYNRVMTPSLLAAGGLAFAFGQPETALGLLQFNPLYDWETSTVSSRFTAIAILGMHGIHLNTPDALTGLSRVRHVVISRSCLDRMGGIRTHEHIAPDSAISKGELLRILAGVQAHLTGDNDVPIWSEQLQRIPDPATVQHVEIEDLKDRGWQVVLADGRQLRIQEPQDPRSPFSKAHLQPLEFWDGDAYLGFVELLVEPGAGWSGVCRTLIDLNIEVHVVGSDSYFNMLDLIEPLGITPESHLHGHFDASDRLELVRNLQQKGEGVAYIGYVLSDMPALSQADVSIGIEVDVDSILTASVCDILIGPDVHWLPRMITLSRRIEQTSSTNFRLIGGSSLLAAAGSAAAWFSPLATVLVSKIPLLLAELRYIAAMTSHDVFDDEHHPQPPQQPAPPEDSTRALSCRLPKSRPHQNSHKSTMGSVA